MQSAVTSKTRYLIAGENTGAAKTSKTRELGTEVIDEARLCALLGMEGAEPEAPAASQPPSMEQGLLF